MARILIMCAVFLLHTLVFGQGVGVGAPSVDSSAILDVQSTMKGVLLPRLTSLQRKNITDPATGLLVFDTDKHTIYLFDGEQWLPMLFSTNPGALPPIHRQASDGIAADRFGFCLAIGGDYAVVGAPYDDSLGVNDLGSAYVFYRENGEWVEQAKLTADDGEEDDFFGVSAAVSGDYIAIGASGDDISSNINQGSVYIFHKGAGWTTGQPFLAKLNASDGDAGDLYGVSVALEGDYLLVGSLNSDIGGNSAQGAAYVYHRDTEWTTGQMYQAKLTAGDGNANDNFGISVSLSGATALIGAAFDTVSGMADRGSAYIFNRSGAVWSQGAKLTASDGAAGDQFGFSVSLSGDYAVIGAPNDDGNSADEGSAYLFFKGAGWSNNQPYQSKLTAPDAANGDQFGNAVSLSGDIVLIGAQSDDGILFVNQGSAYVYVRNGTTWKILRKIDDDTGQSGGFFGHALGIDGYNIAISGFLKYSFQGEVAFLNIE